MAHYTQAGRPLRVTTPLAPDALLLEQFSGREGTSELFRFRLDLLAERPVPFDRLLGQALSVELAPPHGPRRYFHGILSRLSREGRVTAAQGTATFWRYRAELVPRLWLLTRRLQCRIFQQQSLADILGQVLRDEWQLDVRFDLGRTYQPRPQCVQYNESDFAFLSRLLEEEGVCYYFEQTESGHTLVVSDQPFTHPTLAEPSRLRFDEVGGGQRDQPRVSAWRQEQELRAAKFSAWDHCFELPGQHLEAEQPVRDQVELGKGRQQLNHQLQVNALELLEVYEYPGGYARHYDGIDDDGSVQPDELQKIFDANKRVVRTRIEQEALEGLFLEGASDAGHLLPGYVFTLEDHGDADGPYLLTRVEHEAALTGSYTTGDGAESPFRYTNRFRCIPAAMAYRPPRSTPRPRISGAQTATVVGPTGAEIHCDKYGRVKVQFPWDRRELQTSRTQGKHVLHDSSCWVRVAQHWAGKGFGAVHVPRVGQEVVVTFLDGDPDRPLITGGVYNADQLPPFPLPGSAHISGLKSHSVGGNGQQFSGLALQDLPGQEVVQLHGEKDLTLSAENNKFVVVGADQQETVGGNHQHSIAGDQSIAVGGSHSHTVSNVYRLSVGAPGGSGGGGGDWPWDFKAGGDHASITGTGGAFFQDVWGATSELVVGVYNCTVVGSQQYITFINYINFVLGLNVNVLLGPQINYTQGPVFNVHDSGWTRLSKAELLTATTSSISFDAGTSFTINAVGDSMVRVGGLYSVMAVGDVSIKSSGGIELTAIEAINNSAVGMLNVEAPVIRLVSGPCMIQMNPDGILLDAGGMNFVFISPQGVSIGGLQQNWSNALQTQITTVKTTTDAATQLYL